MKEKMSEGKTEIDTKRRGLTEEAGGRVEKISLPRTIHLVPMDRIDGFDVRPGFYEGLHRSNCCCFTAWRRSLLQCSRFRSITASATFIP